LEEEDELRILTRACEPCFSALLSSRDGKLAAYLESFENPAALLSKDQTVISSNSHFRSLASNRKVVGLRLGEILDCMYAPLLGLCGDTVPCLLCKVKRSIEHTWQTGTGLREVPFSFPHKVEARKTFIITTEKAGGAVLLLMRAHSSDALR
jgi:hypothetical protein